MRGTPYLLLVACAEHQVAYIGEASGGRDRLDCLGAVVMGSGFGVVLTIIVSVVVWCTLGSGLSIISFPFS